MLAHTNAVLDAVALTLGVLPNAVPNAIKVPDVQDPVAAVILWLPLSK